MPLQFFYFSEHAAFIFTAHLNTGLIEGAGRKQGDPADTGDPDLGTCMCNASRADTGKRNFPTILSQHAIIKKVQDVIIPGIRIHWGQTHKFIAKLSKPKTGVGGRGVPRHSAIKENCQENIITSSPAPVGFKPAAPLTSGEVIRVVIKQLPVRAGTAHPHRGL